MDECEERQMNQPKNTVDQMIFNNCERLADALLAHHCSYHDHKENMAHAVFLVELVLFSGALTSASKLISSFSALPYPHLDLLAVVTLIWLLTHVALRWQLQSQRWAAMQYAGVLRAFAKWAESPPSPSDLVTVKFKKHNNSVSDKFRRALDTIVWPCYRASYESDLDDHSYPKDLVECIQQQYEGQSYRFDYETVLSGGSIILWLLVIYVILRVS